jgi:hypothetical protein
LGRFPWPDFSPASSLASSRRRACLVRLAGLFPQSSSLEPVPAQLSPASSPG